MIDPALLGMAFVTFVGALIGCGFVIILVGSLMDGAARAKRIGKPVRGRTSEPRVRTTIRN